jgi:hypothetical protein
MFTPVIGTDCRADKTERYALQLRGCCCNRAIRRGEADDAERLGLPALSKLDATEICYRCGATEEFRETDGDGRRLRFVL